MHIVTAEEMLALEQRAIREYGVPAAALMEQAGVAVAEAARQVLASRGIQQLSGARVHIVCGKGNNGGDGLVAARTLANWGARVRIFMMEPEEQFRSGAAVFLRPVKKMGIPLQYVSLQDLKKLRYTLLTADIIIDAILGTGSNGALRPRYAEVVRAVNSAQRPVIAVDVPTGIDTDTGQVADEAVQALRTVTFGLPKLGLLLDPGWRFAGQIHVADIGLPRPLVDDNNLKRQWIRYPEATGTLKRRPVDGHKWTFGRVVVIAGSVGMAGAAILTAKGALRSGAGLVTWMGPAALLDTVQRAVPEATAFSVGDNTWSPAAAEAIASHIRDDDVLALGPGLGRSQATTDFIVALLKKATSPVVIDADALNALAGVGPRVRQQLIEKGQRIVTPHVKEAARLLAWEPKAVEDKRTEAIHRLAGDWDATVVLKGNPTLIQEASGRFAINGTGDVSLATGGTGDVLTGVISGLLASGHSPWEAATLGVYLHGRSGELAGSEFTPYATTAGDVVDMLRTAFLELTRDERDRRNSTDVG